MSYTKEDWKLGQVVFKDNQAYEIVKVGRTKATARSYYSGGVHFDTEFYMDDGVVDRNWSQRGAFDPRWDIVVDRWIRSEVIKALDSQWNGMLANGKYTMELVRDLWDVIIKHGYIPSSPEPIAPILEKP